MSQVRRLIVAAATLGAAGCATPPAPMPTDMDIDFVRGCWVQKDAPGEQVQAFLRLLPDGDSLSGQVADVSTGDAPTAPEPDLRPISGLQARFVCACGMVVRGRSRVSVCDCVAMHVCCCTQRGMSLVVRRDRVCSMMMVGL